MAMQHKAITRRQVRDLKPGTWLLIQYAGAAPELVLLAEKPPRDPGVVPLRVLTLNSHPGYTGIRSIHADLVIAELGKLGVPEIPLQFL